MSSVGGANWQHRASRLADQLVESGVIRSPQWSAAIREVPRHVFVPSYLTQQPDGSWRVVPEEGNSDTTEWLDSVYSDRPLTTALRTDADGQAVAISSSSKPGLMIRMLETLELTDADRVLEIGTGTGYNAGLLSHRLGDRQVASVDIEPSLVTAAGERLASLGYRPTLHIGDGADGLPDNCPYDRIIATCAVQCIPSAWATQLAAGGRILTDLKLTGAAGNLVVLDSMSNRLAGRFLRSWAGFMPLREPGSEQTTPRAPAAVERQTTEPSATPWWDSQVVWFLAALHLPAGIITGMRLDSGRPTAATMRADNGEWAEVAIEPDAGGGRAVTGSAADLWRAVEDARQLWSRLGEPAWDRFGLTVTGDEQVIWVDHPGSAHRWPLPAD